MKKCFFFLSLSLSIIVFSCSYKAKTIIVKDSAIFSYIYYFKAEKNKNKLPMTAFWDNVAGQTREIPYKVYIFTGERDLSQSLALMQSNKLDLAQKVLKNRLNKMALKNQILANNHLYPYLLNNLAIVYLFQKKYNLAKYNIQNSGLNIKADRVAEKVKLNARLITSIARQFPLIAKIANKK